MAKRKDILVPHKSLESGLVRLELLLLRSTPKDRKRPLAESGSIGRMGPPKARQGAARSEPKPEPNPTNQGTLNTPPFERLRDGN